MGAELVPSFSWLRNAKKELKMWNQLDMLLDRKTQEAEREFYGLLGLVAVRFAHLEARLKDLLCTLIHPEDDLMTATLTERFDLARTVDQIIKIGRIRFHDTAKLYELTSSVNSLRQDRNTFIHGIWKITVSDKGLVVATCSRHKISFRENVRSKNWTQRLVPQKVTLEQLAQTATKVKMASQMTEELIEEFSEERY